MYTMFCAITAVTSLFASFICIFLCIIHPKWEIKNHSCIQIMTDMLHKSIGITCWGFHVFWIICDITVVLDEVSRTRGMETASASGTFTINRVILWSIEIICWKSGGEDEKEVKRKREENRIERETDRERRLENTQKEVYCRSTILKNKI